MKSMRAILLASLTIALPGIGGAMAAGYSAAPAPVVDYRGAPVPNGYYVTDSRGQVVQPQLPTRDPDPMAAETGGGN